MSWLRRIFGFDPGMIWWYRDLALGTIASIAMLWAIVALFLVEPNDFDRRLGIACVVIAVVCCVISPNRLVLFGMVAGVVAVRGWFAVVLSEGVKGWWIAGPATAVVVLLLLKFRNRPIQRR